MLEPAVEQRLREVAATAPPEVLAIYLYGSRARGTAGARSDFDLAILLGAQPRPTLESAARDLEAAFQAALHVPSEVVVLNATSPDLAHRVLRDGIILLDRDRAARLRFEVQARNEYFDMEPIRRLYRRIPA